MRLALSAGPGLALSLLLGGVRRGARGFVLLPSRQFHGNDWGEWNPLEEVLAIQSGSPSTPASEWRLAAAPRRGSHVDRYQTVSVNCASCGTRLFRYKKKNGTKSKLVKCYRERICEDSAGLLGKDEGGDEKEDTEKQWACPNCQTPFARSSMIHGRPALKLVGGKIRMTKK